MALDIGSRLGPYELLGLLGSGGIGEVYRARDTASTRRWPIKASPADCGSTGQPATGSSAKLAPSGD